MKGLESELERRTLTYTLWNQTGKDRERKGWHPVTFATADANIELVRRIKVCFIFYNSINWQNLVADAFFF